MPEDHLACPYSVSPVPEPGRPVPDSPAYDLRGANAPVPNASSTTPVNSAASPTSTRSDTAYLDIADDRQRSACPSIAGICYQALVTIRLALDLGPADYLVVEGLEDIDVRRQDGDQSPQASPSPQTSYQMSTTSVQVKYTAADRMNWGDAPVYEAVLEFLIIFSKHPNGVAPHFVFFTPAILGERSSSVIDRWRKHRITPSQAFIVELRDKLRSKILGLDPASPFAAEASRALDQVDNARLDIFVRSVVWNDENPQLEPLRDELADRLAREQARPPLTGRTGVDILLSHVLFLAATHRDDPEARIVRSGFIAACLRQAEGDAAAWGQARLFDRLSTIDRNIDRLLSESQRQTQLLAIQEQTHTNQTELLQQILQQIRTDKGARATSTDQPQSSMTTAASGSLGIPFDGMGGAAIEERCRSIVTRFTTGEIHSALRLIEVELARQPCATGERAYLLYVKACALLGMDREQAYRTADQAASICEDADWRAILSVLAQVYAREEPNAELMVRLEHIAQGPRTDGKAVAAATILGEIDLENDRPEAALRRLQGFGADSRAVKITIRAHNERGDYAVARSLMDLHLRPDDPERARYESHIAIKQFFASFAGCHRELPAEYRARAMSVANILGNALAVCPAETKYRRHEIIGNRAQFLYWAGRPDEAIESLKPMVSIGEVSPEMRFVLAQSYAIKRDVSRAIEHASSCIAECVAATKRELRANAILLRARLYLAERSTVLQIPSSCRELVGDISLAAEYRNRARALIARAYLCSEDPQAAWDEVRSWPATERDEHYEVTVGVLHEHEGRLDEAIEACRGVCERAVEDLGVRHESLFLTAIALQRKGEMAAAAKYGNDAIRIGVSVNGCDVPLSCYRKVGDMAGVESLESYVLSQDPDNVDALRSVVHRLQAATDARAVLDPARRLAAAATHIEDAYVACATMWNRGLRPDAARLFRPWNDRCVTEDQFLLASEACAIIEDWEGALRYALRGFRLHPTSRRIVSLAVQRSLQLGIRGGDRSPYQSEITAVFRSAMTDFTPPILESFNGDAENILAMVRARHQAGIRAHDRYQRHRLSTLALARSFGLWHPESIYHGFIHPDIHFHNGSVPNVSEDMARKINLGNRRMLLDLPSWCMAHAAGVVPWLQRAGTLVASGEHTLLLRNYLAHLRDELVGAQAGTNARLSIAGVVKVPPSVIADEIHFFETLLESIERDAVIETMDQSDGNEQLVADHRGGRQHVCVVVRGVVTQGVTIPVLLDQHSLQVFAGPGLGFNVLLLACRALNIMSEEDYNRTAIRCLRLGLRRVGISFATVKTAYALDGRRIGDNVISVLAHMREGNWRRETLCGSAAAFLLENCEEDSEEIPHEDVIYFLRCLLFGRSFDRKSRRQAIRRMFRLLAAQRVYAPTRWTPTTIDAAEDLLHEIHRRFMLGDPGEHDVRMPGHRRLLGQKIPIPPLPSSTSA